MEIVIQMRMLFGFKFYFICWGCVCVLVSCILSLYQTSYSRVRVDFKLYE